MNKTLWDNISTFSFDIPQSEYGFSTRLAKENFWTQNFTSAAILEYKKFMYLAATSDMMVSPSEIVDTVWHQHLIFTQSYNDFCNLIGKQIQHIPSTHNKVDFQRFKQAKERTSKLYEATFGAQPKGIWAFSDMYASLNLRKAKLKLRTFIIIGILTFLIFMPLFFILLESTFIQIQNPSFIWSYLSFAAVIFAFLQIYNHTKLIQITKNFSKDSFIYNLAPYELVYLKNQTIESVINGSINELIDNATISIEDDKKLELKSNNLGQTIEQFQIITTLNELGRSTYPYLIKKLSTKPLFNKTFNCMNALSKYFIKSLKFGRLFYLNFSLMAMVIMLGVIRLSTGIIRNKPIVFLAFVVIALTIFMIIFLHRLTKRLCTETIPKLYKDEILTQKQIESDWQWRYFVMGTTALTASLFSVFTYFKGNDTTGGNGNSSCGSSCGSSCSSCGGGCGGCGGS
ncbi:MAG: hypothetical protein V4613_07845 [Bacteroidota bacterium]